MMLCCRDVTAASFLPFKDAKASVEAAILSSEENLMLVREVMQSERGEVPALAASDRQYGTALAMTVAEPLAART